MELVECMKASGSDFVRQRLQENERKFGMQDSSSGGRAAGVRKVKKYTVSSEFRFQLEDLMGRIRATEPHFVRCIKPNAQSLPNQMDRRSVVEQLRYQGVIQAIKVSCTGYPLRLKHRQAVLRFRCLAPQLTRLHLESQVASSKFAEAARWLFEALGAESGSLQLESDNWAVGNTLVFFKKEGLEKLGVALARAS